MKKDTVHNFETVRSLFALLEYEHPEIIFSGIHVQLLTRLFYEFLPFQFRRKIHYEQLMYGALLRDIGKLRLPAEVLNKPGKLKEDEWKMVKSHAKLGAEMLSTVPGMEKLKDWILYHHERVDGRGYFGLKGEEIPLEARMLMITDAYSSIVMASSFKPSRMYEDAISVLRLGAGSQFDEELVEIFCQIPMNAIVSAAEQTREIIESVQIRGEWVKTKCNDSAP